MLLTCLTTTAVDGDGNETARERANGANVAPRFPAPGLTQPPCLRARARGVWILFVGAVALRLPSAADARWQCVAVTGCAFDMD